MYVLVRETAFCPLYSGLANRIKITPWEELEEAYAELVRIKEEDVKVNEQGWQEEENQPVSSYNYYIEVLRIPKIYIVTWSTDSPPYYEEYFDAKSKAEVFVKDKLKEGIKPENIGITVATVH
jgi:hypothetical protein